MIIPQFPALPLHGYSIHKKPTFASIIMTPPSGRETTGLQMPYPQWEFELPYEVLRDQSQNQVAFGTVPGYAELRTISEFWLSCNGQYTAFLYSDPGDNSREGQGLGTGDGTTSSFLLQRTWGTGSLSLIEPIGIADVRVGSTFKIYLDDIELAQAGNWWIDPRDLRTLMFTTAPGNGVVITGDFSFFYYCRFIEDVLDLEEFMTGRWSLGALRFRSTKPDPPATLTTSTITDQDPDLTTPQASIGLFYFEATVVSANPSHSVCVGVANASFNLDDPADLVLNAPQPGTAFGAFLVSPGNGTIGTSYGYPDRIPGNPWPVALGQVIGVAVDVVNSRMWTKNATTDAAWRGSTVPAYPSDSATGYYYGNNIPSGSLYILLGGGYWNFSTVVDATLTLNAGASAFVISPLPTGYVAWGAATVLNSTDKSTYVDLSPGDLTMTVDTLIPGPHNENSAFVRSTTFKAIP